jgi:type I restriction enzyme S subunit
MNLAGNEKYMTSCNNYISVETARDLNIKVHQSGTVIFPKIGGAIATNKRRILTSASAIDNNCLGLTPGDNISTEYLYLILSSIDFTFYQVGTSVPALQIQKIGLIPVWIPNLETQNLIVSLADRLLLELKELQTKNHLVVDMKDKVISSWISSMSKMKERVA